MTAGTVSIKSIGRGRSRKDRPLPQYQSERQAAFCAKEIIRAVLSVWTIQLGLVNWNIYDGRYIIFCQDFVLNPCCSQEISHWTIVYMHVLHWCTTHSNCGRKILPFISKIYLDGRLWSALIFKRFFALFHLPYFGISQKIGHTGIANTKKWLDQAVFPCWSNYHTLAGE